MHSSVDVVTFDDTVAKKIAKRYVGLIGDGVLASGLLLTHDPPQVRPYQQRVQTVKQR